MENIFIELLPPWIETGLQPAFYDKESGTILQQVSRMYYKINELIKNNNNLNNDFRELYKYVHDYFDNLDVQEEINHKLDEMAEAGTLEEIIAVYIHSSAVLGFDTLADLKSSVNVVDGSFARTLGYHTKGDGGGSDYKVRAITNEDVVDEFTIVELSNGLIAELIDPVIATPEMAGCVGDGTTDDTANMQKLFNKYNIVQLTDNKTYLISSTITLRNVVKIIGNGYRTRIKSVINDGTPLFYNNDTIAGTGRAFHFDIENFYLDGDNKDAIAFLFAEPYDSCVFRDLYFANFKNTVIKCGNNNHISQTLVIDNIIAYTSADGTYNVPIIYLIKCYESNILNTKFMNQGIASSPCLKLENVYDANIQGCSFTRTTDCGILITGSECRYNRIISNTYEDLRGDYSIKLDGSIADGVKQTLIIEAGTYYNAPAKIYCNNECEGTFIGMTSYGGRRNMAINVSAGNVTDPYGNLALTSQSGNLFTRGYMFENYDKSPGWTVFSNDSADNDYGLLFRKTGHSNFSMRSKSFVIDDAGGKIRLTSPDGTVTRYIGISNSGNVYTSEYEES